MLQKELSGEMNMWVVGHAEEIVNMDIKLQLFEKWMGV